jgi:hypothetical protein
MILFDRGRLFVNLKAEGATNARTLDIYRSVAAGERRSRAVMLEDAIEGTDEQLGAFLTSNDLWAGIGLCGRLCPQWW